LWVTTLTSALTLAVVACSSDDGKPASGTTPTTSGNDAGDADSADNDSGTSGKKKNAEGPCERASDCESGICFVGGNQSYCAVQCTADNGPTVCAAPFTGSCNKQGYCKRD
jgi:hypothetical protein